MNKAVGIAIGVVVIALAAGIGGSTFFSDSIGNSIPTDDSNRMQMGDKLSVTVTPTEEIENEQVEEEEESTEGKKLEVNLVDGISATSTP